MNDHPQQWAQLQGAWMQARLAHALLFAAPLHCPLNDFTTDLCKLIICQQNKGEPCLKCQDCLMVSKHEHPDMEWIRPEKIGSAIKIDQIRQLQLSVYLTPQRASHRIIIIETADRMNISCANALLKILEEPPKHIIFILQASQISTILPTVLSRCCIMRFASADDFNSNNLLSYGTKYPEDSANALIISQAESILDTLIAMIEGKEQLSVAAASIVKFDLNILLWFLYLVFAQLLRMNLTKATITGPASQQLVRLASLLNPILIFTQLDLINSLLKKILGNLNPNPTYAIENFLLSFKVFKK